MTPRLSAGLALIALDNSGGRVLLLRRSQRVHDHRGKWNLPGGGIDPGETARDAAAREAFEEAGYDHRRHRAQVRWLHDTPLYTTVVATLVGRSPAVKMNWESDQWRWVTREQALGLNLHPGLRVFFEGITDDFQPRAGGGRGRAARAPRSTKAAEKFLVEKYGEKHPQVAALTLWVARRNQTWPRPMYYDRSGSVTLAEQLGDNRKIPWQTLPLIPWLAAQIRQLGKKPPRVRDYFKALVPHLHIGTPLARTWAFMEEDGADVRGNARLPWRLEKATRAALGPARAAEVMTAARTYQLGRVYGTLLSDVGDWARSNSVDLGKYTLNEALAATDDWHAELARRTRPSGEPERIRLRAGDQSQVVLRLPGGWTWQRIHPRNLEAEGAAMGNCLASYNEQVGSGNVTVYGLHDRQGQPHVAVEVGEIDENAVARLDTAWDDRFTNDDGWVFFNADWKDPDDVAAIKRLPGFKRFVKELDGNQEAALGYLKEVEAHASSEGGRFFPPGQTERVYKRSIDQIEGLGGAPISRSHIPSLVALINRFNAGDFNNIDDLGVAKQYMPKGS